MTHGEGISHFSHSSYLPLIFIIYFLYTSLPVNYVCFNCISPWALMLCLSQCFMLGLAFAFTHMLVLNNCTPKPTNTCAYRHTQHSWWELPVYLINSTWLEAKYANQEGKKKQHKNISCLTSSGEKNISSKSEGKEEEEG